MIEEPRSIIFGREVARRREGLRFSQRQAAQSAGLSQTAWRDIERGHDIRDGNRAPRQNPPRRTTVIAMADLLRWDRNEALTAAGHDTSAEPSPPADEQASPDVAGETLHDVREMVRRLRWDVEQLERVLDREST